MKGAVESEDHRSPYLFKTSDIINTVNKVTPRNSLQSDNWLLHLQQCTHYTVGYEVTQNELELEVASIQVNEDDVVDGERSNSAYLNPLLCRRWRSSFFLKLLTVVQSSSSSGSKFHSLLTLWLKEYFLMSSRNRVLINPSTQLDEAGAAVSANTSVLHDLVNCAVVSNSS